MTHRYVCRLPKNPPSVRFIEFLSSVPYLVLWWSGNGFYLFRQNSKHDTTQHNTTGTCFSIGSSDTYGSMFTDWLWVAGRRVIMPNPSSATGRSLEGPLRALNPFCSMGAVSWMTLCSDLNFLRWDMPRKVFTMPVWQNVENLVPSNRSKTLNTF